MLSGAAPQALSSYGRGALSMDDELAVSASRLAALAPGLAADVAGFARGAAAVDRWVGRVGASFAAADSAGPIWVDRLSDREATSIVLALGRELAPSLRSLSAADRGTLALAFFPLWLRVRSLWPAAVMRSSSAVCATLPRRPEGVDAALDVLRFPDRSRRTDVVTGFLDGLVLGAFDDRGFDNASAEWARAIGHAISGFFVVGDVRDLVADVAHGDALAAVLDAIALIPVAGDVLKVGRLGANAADAAHDVERAVVDLAEHQALGGHVLKHVGRSDAQLAQRLVDEPTIPAASSFVDEATANRVVTTLLDGRADDIAEWLEGPRRQLSLSATLGGPVGRVWPRDAAAAMDSTRLKLILRRSHGSAHGYYVHTVVLEP